MCLPACHGHLARFISRRNFLGGLGVVAASTSGAAPAATPLIPGPFRRIVDLTHTLDPDFPTFSGESQFTARTLAALDTDGWNFREWRVHEHTGTHIDAPFHRSTGPSVDALAPESLVGPLVVIDLRARASANADTELTPDDLRTWEQDHGPLPTGAIVAMSSGWGAYARSPKFRNPDDRGTLRFPGLHAETAAWLLEKENVKGIVVDTLSLDPGSSTTFPVHTRWLGAGRWGLECAANLEKLPPSGATIVVGAPKVAGGSGGPSRVFAFV